MHIPKQFIVIFVILVIGFSLSGKAQTNDSLLNQLSARWINAKTYALKVAELVPEAQYNFRPVP